MISWTTPTRFLHPLFSLHPCSLSVARWLAGEVREAITDVSLLHGECVAPSASLSPRQEQLVSAICHLQDTLTNRLGATLPSSLLPPAHFSSIGGSILESLRRVHEEMRGVLSRTGPGEGREIYIYLQPDCQ